MFSTLALSPFAVLMAGFYLYCIGAHFLGIGGPLFSGSFRLLMDVFAFIGLLLIEERRYWRRNIFFEVLLYLFSVLCFLNWYFVADQSAYGLKKLGFLCIIALIPFYLTKLLSSVANNQKLVKLIACLSLLLSISSIAVFMSDNSFEIARGRFTMIEGWNTIPSCLVSGLAVIWGWWLIAWGEKKMVRYLMVFVIVVLSLYAMYLTGSRGPVLSLFLAMVLVPPMRLSFFSMKKGLVAVVLVFVFTGALLFGSNDDVRMRFGSLFSKNRISQTGRLDTVGQRERRYSYAFKAGYEHTLFGRGLGTTPEHHYAHNSFLELWEELGLAGGMFYVLFFGGGVLIAYRRRMVFGRLSGVSSADTTIWFWETVFLYSFFEGLFSLTVFGNVLLWVSMGMVVMCPRDASNSEII